MWRGGTISSAKRPTRQWGEHCCEQEITFHFGHTYTFSKEKELVLDIWIWNSEKSSAKGQNGVRSTSRVALCEALVDADNSWRAWTFLPTVFSDYLMDDRGLRREPDLCLSSPSFLPPSFLPTFLPSFLTSFLPSFFCLFLCDFLCFEGRNQNFM